MAWILSDYEKGPLNSALSHYVDDVNELERMEKALVELKNKCDTAVETNRLARTYLAKRMDKNKVYVLGTYALNVAGPKEFPVINIIKAEIL